MCCVPAVRDENVRVAPCAAHWAGNDPVVLEHVHSAFHEQRDHSVVENARSADLGCERRDACIDKRVCQEAGVSAVVEDLIDGK
jgi:hypothetical protein